MDQQQKKFDFSDLFTFEIANNHQGDISHGKSIIKAMGEIARTQKIKAAIKFQFRDFDSFIHPKHRKKSENKHIPRFLSTRLSEDDFKKLVNEVRKEGLLVMVTPFDEKSVDIAIKLGADILKVASCSAKDFPLLEKITRAGRPIIASTGGLSIHEIDNLVSFLDHRYSHFAIMHCVSIYPTPLEKMRLSVISTLRKRYPGVAIGFSTHESPDNTEAIQLSYASGARIFEKHVGLPTNTITLNAYSANPEQTKKWIEAWKRAREALGEFEKKFDEIEQNDLLSLMRGVFAKKSIRKGQKLTIKNTYFAFPIEKGQLPSGKFTDDITVNKAYIKDEAISLKEKLDAYSPKNIIYPAIHTIKGMLNEAGIIIPLEFELEFSHHYGLENFHKYGAVLVDCINREYGKKIIIQLPGQTHPNHHHMKKEESFHILSGILELDLAGRHKILHPGDIQIIQRGIKHRFWTKTGVIFEEISTTNFNNDSIYEDPKIESMPRSERKTKLTNWGRYHFDEI